MAFQDFRAYLTLRQAGELVDVDRGVALKFEVAKALRKSVAVSGPAFVFKSNGTEFPVIGGLYNSRALCRLLVERSGGITLSICRALERAGATAIRTGRERIDLTSLGDADIWRGLQVAGATRQRLRPAALARSQK